MSVLGNSRDLNIAIHPARSQDEPELVLTGLVGTLWTREDGEEVFVLPFADVETMTDCLRIVAQTVKRALAQS